MKRLGALFGFVLALFFCGGCISDAVNAGRETVTWAGKTVYDGGKFAYEEAKYGLFGNRPREFDPESDRYYNGNFLGAYNVEPEADDEIAQAFDLAMERCGENTLSREQVLWIFGTMDINKDRRITQDEAQIGLNEVCAVASQTADNPFVRRITAETESSGELGAKTAPASSRLRSTRDTAKVSGSQ